MLAVSIGGGAGAAVITGQGKNFTVPSHAIINWQSFTFFYYNLMLNILCRDRTNLLHFIRFVQIQKPNERMDDKRKLEISPRRGPSQILFAVHWDLGQCSRYVMIEC